jgi:hypothetical protein
VTIACGLLVDLIFTLHLPSMLEAAFVLATLGLGVAAYLSAKVQHGKARHKARDACHMGAHMLATVAHFFMLVRLHPNGYDQGGAAGA